MGRKRTGAGGGPGGGAAESRSGGYKPSAFCTDAPRVTYEIVRRFCPERNPDSVCMIVREPDGIGAFVVNGELWAHLSHLSRLLDECVQAVRSMRDEKIDKGYGGALAVDALLGSAAELTEGLICVFDWYGYAADARVIPDDGGKAVQAT